MITTAKLIDDILKAEGGYVNHKADRGGPTKYGITIGTLSAVRGEKQSTQDVKNLTIAEARTIYKQRYLLGPKIHGLPVRVRAVIFDMAVNSGPSRAVKTLQYVLNRAGFGPVAEDGKVGSQTITASSDASQKMGNYLVNAIVDERDWFYHDLVRRRPKNKAFINGWMNRLKKFRVST